MTFEEAKKILEKEFAVINLHKSTEPFEFDDSNWFKHEKPSVLEAFRVLSKEGYYITISGHDYDMRKKRLDKEYEKNTKAPGSAENLIKEDSGVNPALKESATQFNDALLDEQAKKIAKQDEEITRLLSLVEKKENSISRLYYEKSVLEKENEDLKKGEIPARYFDKALVDEQAEKIKKLEHEKLDILEIASSSKQTIAEQADKIKRLGKEITRLNKIIRKKNLKIEELRKESSRHLGGKIKMFGENFDLEQELKDKNAVLADVAEELRLSKIREKNLTEVCQKYVKEVEDLREKLANKVVDKIDAQALKSAESALAYKEKVIEKLQKQLKYKSPLPSGSVEAINIYVNNISRASRGGFNKSVASTMGETELSETYEYGDKKLKYALHFNEDGSITYECSDPDKKNRHNGDGLPTPEEPKHDNSFKDFISKTIDNFNRRAAELGCVGGKDGNGILDQMVGVDIAEEGEDHSGVIVLCGKDFIDAIKKMK
jgi:hypothetical protein